MIKKVSVVIPIYNPEIKVLEKVREMVKKQTVKNEIIEIWNLPEGKSMNKGILEAKNKIVVTLHQDCIPENDGWLKKLIFPFKDPKVSVSVSDLYLPRDYWEKYPFYTRILALKDRVVRRPGMDARGCAYRKKDLIEAGLFNEGKGIVASEERLHQNISKIGKIVHTGSIIYHLHPMDNRKKFLLDYNYSYGNGQRIRAQGLKGEYILRRLLRGIPIFGLIPILGIFPFRKFPLYFPIYLLFSPIQHVLSVYGFWMGFIGKGFRR